MKNFQIFIETNSKKIKKLLLNHLIFKNMLKKLICKTIIGKR